MATPDLTAAGAAVDLASRVLDQAWTKLGQRPIDDQQVFAYDLAHAAAAIETAKSGLEYGGHGDTESALATVFAAEAIAELAARTFGREAEWGIEPGALDGTRGFVAEHRAPAFLASLAGEAGLRHLDADFEMVQDTFRRFAEDKIRPVAEHVHRTNGDIPEEVISGLAELGAFGLSVPEEYGGFATGGESDYLGMVVATEELSRGSLGVGGSLITRPEILARALVAGGTEAQKRDWLPKIATGEIMAAVAVTEPDYGSDANNVKTTATRDDANGGWRINGVKTWCTFAGRADALMLLARTDPDRSKAQKGLSLFIVPKPRAEGHAFQFEGQHGGKIEGRAIDTIGYRGMHSYEVALDNWWVPDESQIGGEEGLHKGFYFTMGGFENGRLQTAARAIGVMQAAYETAVEYANGRVIFGRPLAEYELTQAKLTRMAATIQIGRQSMYEVARLMAKGGGRSEVAMLKAYLCRAAEWITREAMQIHGGMGYAEEFAVSRYFVDARVLSIFEGADEILALKVIARRAEGGPARATR
jgi:(2S)-methylsuccinyl-CoA dehydrogenase